VVIEGTSTPYDNVIVRGDVAVISYLDGTFTDLSGYYMTGMTNAGYTPDLYYDPHGSVDYSSYLIHLRRQLGHVVVL